MTNKSTSLWTVACCAFPDKTYFQVACRRYANRVCSITEREGRSWVKECGLKMPPTDWFTTRLIEQLPPSIIRKGESLIQSGKHLVCPILLLAHFDFWPQRSSPASCGCKSRHGETNQAIPTLLIIIGRPLIAQQEVHFLFFEHFPQKCASELHPTSCCTTSYSLHCKFHNIDCACKHPFYITPCNVFNGWWRI